MYSAGLTSLQGQIHLEVPLTTLVTVPPFNVLLAKTRPVAQVAGGAVVQAARLKASALLATSFAA